MQKWTNSTLKWISAIIKHETNSKQPTLPKTYLSQKRRSCFYSLGQSRFGICMSKWSVIFACFMSIQYSPHFKINKINRHDFYIIFFIKFVLMSNQLFLQRFVMHTPLITALTNDAKQEPTLITACSIVIDRTITLHRFL